MFPNEYLKHSFSNSIQHILTKKVSHVGVWWLRAKQLNECVWTNTVVKQMLQTEFKMNRFAI